MFCNRCGAALDGNSKFCTSCGQEVILQNIPQRNTVRSAGKNNNRPVYYANTNQSVEMQQPANSKTVGMIWHKVYVVLLIIGAIANLGTGVQAITGSEYEKYQAGFKEVVYSMYTGLKTADTWFAISCFCIAGYQIFVAYRLAKLKLAALQCLITLHFYIIAVRILYSLVLSNATGQNWFEQSVFKQIWVYLLFGVLLTVYYFKRKDMFVNP